MKFSIVNVTLVNFSHRVLFCKIANEFNLFLMATKKMFLIIYNVQIKIFAEKPTYLWAFIHLVFLNFFSADYKCHIFCWMNLVFIQDMPFSSLFCFFFLIWDCPFIKLDDVEAFPFSTTKRYIFIKTVSSHNCTLFKFKNFCARSIFMIIDKST